MNENRHSVAGEASLFHLLQLSVLILCTAAGGHLGARWGIAWGVVGVAFGIVLGCVVAWVGIFYIAVWCSRTRFVQPRMQHEAISFLTQSTRKPTEKKD
jgi:hypothetical protein